MVYKPVTFRMHHDVAADRSPRATCRQVHYHRGWHSHHFTRTTVHTDRGKGLTDVISTPQDAAREPDPARDGGPADTTQPLDAEQTYAWAPTEDTPRRRRRWLWAAIPVGVLAIGAAAASTVLIAPGVSVAGVSVGWMTPGAASDAVATQLADTTVEISGTDAALTAADLGASVDARALTNDAFAEHPMWNVTAWFPEPIDAPVTLDTAVAAETLGTAAPGLYVAPVDAGIVFDEDAKKYAVVAAEPGTGVDLEHLRGELETAFAAGTSAVSVDTQASEVPALVTTAAAEDEVAELNGMIKNAGFYVGDEKTVPVKAATLASWLTVTANDQGTFDVTADTAAIQEVVDGLAGKVNRDAVNASVITNSSGTVLSESTAGVTGRELASTDGIADAFAASLESGSATYPLEVNEVEYTTATSERLLEVDLSEQRLYVKENGNVVDSWLISSGQANTPTYEGRYRVGYHITSQTMRSTHPTDPAWNYEVPNVKWVMYFNGDQAFHGVYWHSNWGTPMSHGCIGMPEWRAEWIYNWAPNGVDVWIHG